jgi:hypothetical protein
VLIVTTTTPILSRPVPPQEETMALCQNRLQEERKQWRRDHPFGFYAKPQRTKEGVLDVKNWECGIPGKDNTIWSGGLFKLTIIFPDGETQHGTIRCYCDMC